MDDLNFTSSADKQNAPAHSSYDAAAALSFFRSAGREQDVAAGETIFHEDSKSNRLLFQRDKMYLLLQGEVELTVKGKCVGSVLQGEIFGEMASITQTARSATATAKTACRLIALDDRQFQASLRENPEFALALMSLMVRRLRKMAAEPELGELAAAREQWNESGIFDKKLLAELVNELGDNARLRYLQGKAIMQEGQAGVLMYVVLEGCVAITIQGTVVEKIGPGGMFGEMALIERAERLASAIAESDCSLLAINRNAFLDLVKNNPEFGVTILSAIGERARFMMSRHTQ